MTDFNQNSIKMHRIQERIQELGSFIELIIRSSYHEIIYDDPKTYADYVQYLRDY